MLFTTVRVFEDERSSIHIFGVIVVFASTAPPNGTIICLKSNFCPIFNTNRITDESVADVEYWSMPKFVAPVSVHAGTTFGVTLDDC